MATELPQSPIEIPTGPKRIALKPVNPLGFVVLLGVFTVAYAVSHGAALEADVPPWAVSHYEPTDECIYVLPAIDSVTTNERAQALVRDHPGPNAAPLASPLLVAVTRVTLALLGPTLNGVRLAPLFLVWLSCVGALVFVWQASRGLPGRHQWPLLTLVALALSSDYGLTLAARISEPTSGRMCAAVWLLLWLSFRSAQRRSILTLSWVAFATTAGVLLVYPTNAFTIPAAALTVLMISPFQGGWRRKLLTHSAAWLVGAGVAVGLYLVVMRWMGGFGSGSISNYSARLALPGRQFLTGLVHNVVFLFQASSMKINPLLLVLSLAAAPTVWSLSSAPMRRPEVVALASMLFFLVAQCLVLNDYPERKLVIFVPFLVMVAAFGVVKWLQVHPRTGRDTWLLSLAVLWTAVAAAAHLVPNKYTLYAGPLWLLVVKLGSLAAVLGAALQPRWRLRGLAFATALACAGSWVLAWQTTVNQATFLYRDAMVQMGAVVNRGVVTGSLAKSLPLYHGAATYLNPFTSLSVVEAVERAVESGHAEWVLGFSDCQYFSTPKLHSGIRLEPVQTFELRGMEDLCHRATLSRAILVDRLTP